MSLLLDWTVATEEALTAAETRRIVYNIEKNFDQLEKDHIVDGKKLTHADVYLLMSIYAFELYRFLCEPGGNPPEPRSTIHEFFNSPDVLGAVRASRFKLFTAGSGSPNTFERVVFYYANIKDDYISPRANGPCSSFRTFSNMGKLSTGGRLFYLPFTVNDEKNLNTLKNKTGPSLQDRKNYHILRFKWTCSNLVD